MCAFAGETVCVYNFKYYIINLSSLLFLYSCGRGQPEGSLFNSYYTEVKGRAILFSLDCTTLPFIRTLKC